MITILGFLAAFFTTVCQIPQAIKVIKTKNTKSISLYTYIFLTLGIGLWAVYGIFLKDLPIAISNSLLFGITSMILFYKIKYK